MNRFSLSNTSRSSSESCSRWFYELCVLLLAARTWMGLMNRSMEVDLLGGYENRQTERKETTEEFLQGLWWVVGGMVKQ